jgi:4'-phosphopantetheinyl transferase
MITGVRPFHLTDDPMAPLRLHVALDGACVWLMNLRHEPDAQTWAACQPIEHERAARFKFAVHARRYRAAHAGMRQVLASHLGVALLGWAWQPGTHGKPHFTQAEHGHFNLSHSEDWALLAWHLDLPIGVDIEWVRELPDLDSLAAHHFTEAELAWLQAVDAGVAREARFYRLWSAKEASLKALGSGLLVAPQRVEVPLGGMPDRCATHIELGPTDARAMGSHCRLTVTEVALPEGLRAQAAVALVNPGDQALCW